MSDDQQWDPEVTQQTILLMLMRLYDVGMSLLSELNDERAEHIEGVHDAGGLITEMPWLNQSDTQK